MSNLQAVSVKDGTMLSMMRLQLGCNLLVCCGKDAHSGDFNIPNNNTYGGNARWIVQIYWAWYSNNKTEYQNRNLSPI